MKTIITTLSLLITTVLLAQTPVEILQKVDANLTAESVITHGKMIIHTKRGSREMESKSYTKGETHSFTEYLAPAREKGTKMLKLDDRLWIYSPSTDRTIQLSGHMLRQSVMGSDLSYEDMMEDRKLTEMYNAVIESEETINGVECWVLKLTAKVEDISYDSRKIWVDKQKYVTLKEDLFAKSGELLKRTQMSDFALFGKRWYPKKMNYKDMLKNGKGTDFEVVDIQFNPEIPDIIFNKASLRK